MSRGSHEDRLARNAESKQNATHDREPWSQDELDQLFGYWDGTEDTLAEIAELLGRTIEACRERYYKARKGGIRTREITVTAKIVTGWLVGYCFECGNFTDVYSDGQIARCEECKGD